jgi:hypothetical protein
MKKVILSLSLMLCIFVANAQNYYVKYEFMKVMPGQDYEKLEKSWVNYHKELIKADIISMHRVWKVLPGNDVDYDYVVTTVYSNYQDALGLGKSISVDDFKKNYPEDYEIMYSTTLKTRTMVRDAIMSLDLPLGPKNYVVTPGESLMSMNFIKSKNGKYTDAEIAFSKKWHNGLIDSGNKMAFNFMHSMGGQGTESRFSHVITHLFSNMEQMNKKVDMTKNKMSAEETANLNNLVTYRDITKIVLHVNVMSLEK